MALTNGRKTPCLPRSEQSNDLIAYPIAASTTLYAGGLVGVNAAGYLVPMGPASLKCVGVAWIENGQRPPTNGKFDNSAGANGAFMVTVRKGVQFFANLGSDPVVVGDMQSICYAYDDYTVQHTSGTNSIAGVVVRVVDGTLPGDELYGPGVWVDVGLALPYLSTILNATTITGNPTAAGQVLIATAAGAAHWATVNQLNNTVVTGDASGSAKLTATGSNTASWV